MTEPICTQMAMGKHNAIITSEAFNSFIGKYPVTNKQHEVGKKIEVDDCYYRMIRAKEVGNAMAFADDYIVYGDERQQVRQFGNAVTPPVMEWLVERCVESLN